MTFGTQVVRFSQVVNLGYDLAEQMKASEDSNYTPVPSLFGRCFAFYAEPLQQASEQSGIPLHNLLLERAIAGLIEQKSKQPVFVGLELPTGMTRVFVCAQKDNPWTKLYPWLAKLPGFIESGDDGMRLDHMVPLAFWTPDGTAAALWMKDWDYGAFSTSAHEAEMPETEFTCLTLHDQTVEYVNRWVTFQY